VFDGCVWAKSLRKCGTYKKNLGVNGRIILELDNEYLGSAIGGKFLNELLGD
jgi:hypothetical protein